MGSGPKFPHIDILFSTVSSFLQTFGQLMLHFVWDVGYLTMLHQKSGKKISTATLTNLTQSFNPISIPSQLISKVNLNPTFLRDVMML
jgi:hypothetical protein